MTARHRAARVARRLLKPKPSPRPAPWFPSHISTRPPDDVITMGRESYSRPRVEWHVGDTGRIRIGAFCSIHHTVIMFTGGEHRPDWVTTFALRERLKLPGAFESGLPYTRGDVVVGNDVYIGYESLVLSGVTIGNGAVIAARSVVTRDVPAYSIVAGSPAKVVRQRFDDDQQAALERIRWWDWSEAEIVANIDLLSGPVEDFLRAHDAEYAARPAVES